jgi:hypothetical protein
VNMIIVLMGSVCLELELDSTLQCSENIQQLQPSAISHHHQHHHPVATTTPNSQHTTSTRPPGRFPVIEIRKVCGWWVVVGGWWVVGGGWCGVWCVRVWCGVCACDMRCTTCDMKRAACGGVVSCFVWAMDDGWAMGHGQQVAEIWYTSIIILHGHYHTMGWPMAASGVWRLVTCVNDV